MVPSAYSPSILLLVPRCRSRTCWPVMIRGGGTSTTTRTTASASPRHRASGLALPMQNSSLLGPSKEAADLIGGRLGGADWQNGDFQGAEDLAPLVEFLRKHIPERSGEPRTCRNFPLFATITSPHPGEPLQRGSERIVDEDDEDIVMRSQFGRDAACLVI